MGMRNLLIFMFGWRGFGKRNLKLSVQHPLRLKQKTGYHISRRSLRFWDAMISSRTVFSILEERKIGRILNTEFTDVAQVANAARNIEIFRDRPKNEGDNKRDRDSHCIRPSKTPSQGSNPRADDRRDSDRYGNRGRHGNRDRYGTNKWHGDRQGSDRHGNGTDRQGNGSQKVWRDQDKQVQGQHYSRSYRSSSQSGYSDYNSCPLCNLCGKFHPGKACHRATGACFECGEVGHLAKDCKKGSMSSGGKRFGTFSFKFRL
ncbi:reverse transcriptase domain-containing protein [Tanacetum coccineum]